MPPSFISIQDHSQRQNKNPGTYAFLPLPDVLGLTVAAGTNQKSASTAFRNNRNNSAQIIDGMKSPNKVWYHRLYRRQKLVRTGIY